MSRIRKIFALVMLALGALPIQAMAQSANGAHILDVIDQAITIWNQSLNLCTSANFPNATLMDDCQAYTDDILGVIEPWETNYHNNTLTVAYDAQVEDLLQVYETDLQNVLDEAGYTYTPSSDSSSIASLQLSPDDLDSTAVGLPCNTACATVAVAGTGVCIKLTSKPLYALGCLVAVGTVFLICNKEVCSTPPAPPKYCG